MRLRLPAVWFLFSLAVCNASAAPVLYSFAFTASNPNGTPSLSFQYSAPGYITGNFGSSPLLTISSLSNVSIDPAYSLSTVVLSQTILPGHSSVDVQTTLLEKFDFNQPITIDFNLTTDSSGASILLDRDGTYTQNLSNGRAILSVTSTPEPATASLLLLAVPVAWLYRNKRRIKDPGFPKRLN